MAIDDVLKFVAGTTDPFITKPFPVPGSVTVALPSGVPRNLTGWVGTLHYRLDGVGEPLQTITGVQVVGDAMGVLTATPNPDEILVEGFYTARITADDVNPSPTDRVASEQFRFRVVPIVEVVG